MQRSSRDVLIHLNGYFEGRGGGEAFALYWLYYIIHPQWYTSDGHLNASEITAISKLDASFRSGQLQDQSHFRSYNPVEACGCSEILPYFPACIVLESKTCKRLALFRRVVSQIGRLMYRHNLQSYVSVLKVAANLLPPRLPCDEWILEPLHNWKNYCNWRSDWTSILVCCCKRNAHAETSAMSKCLIRVKSDVTLRHSQQPLCFLVWKYSSFLVLKCGL